MTHSRLGLGFLLSTSMKAMDVFLCDHCILDQNLPFHAHALDYSSELNLFAILECQTIHVWNPETRKTISEFEIGWVGASDVLFLPGNYIAVPGGEANHGYSISVFSLTQEEPVLVIEEDDMTVCDPFFLTLNPDKNILAAEVGSDDEGATVAEIQLDLDNMKVLGSRNIWTFEGMIGRFCCSSDYTIYCSAYEDNSFSCVQVGFTADGEVELSNEQTITYCMINGEERSFDEIQGLEQDGENVIVATDKDIILMESATEGSPAHIIASSGIVKHDLFYDIRGGIRLTDKNQLVVCDGGHSIKVYDYKRPNCLQGLCRYNINKTLKRYGEKKASVDQLPIPKSLKDYLLYKV